MGAVNAGPIAFFLREHEKTVPFDGIEKADTGFPEDALYLKRLDLRA